MRNSSEGIPFIFSKNFQWKGAIHLIFLPGKDFFRTNGKRSRSRDRFLQKAYP